MRLFGAALLWLQFATHAEVVHFTEGVPGKLPAGWSIAMTHAGPPPRWEIVRDESAPSPPFVLAQVSRDKTAGRFPLAIWEKMTTRNGEARTAFKTVDGTVDQAAGLVWRYQDANNYYIVRANALENNVVLYKVEKGIRLSIAPKGLPSRSYGVKHDVPKGRWNTLAITFTGSTFTVLLNGDRLFEADDKTFTEAGKTGLWTKADSVTYFNQFTVVGWEGKPGR